MACINSIGAYYDANMEFLNEKVNKELFYNNFPIYTKPKDACPTQYTETSSVVNSIIANGSYIEGTVKNSVIGRNVYIGKGSVIENCVILQNTVIGNNVTMIEGTVKNSVIGRNVYIGKGSVIENCVILQNTVIGNNVTMNNTITDKGTLIDDNEEVKGLENNPLIIPKKRVV